MIPTVDNVDGLIKSRYSVDITQKLVSRLQNEAVIYEGQFEMGMRSNGPYVIDDTYFTVPNSKENVDYTLISWSMFGGYTAICRKDLLSDETLVAINKNLKKGKVSFCTVYDAFVLWNLFRKESINEPCWVGLSQLKMNNFEDGIFKLENDDKDLTCLLLGRMYGAVTFSSQCRIFFTLSGVMI